MLQKVADMMGVSPEVVIITTVILVILFIFFYVKMTIDENPVCLARKGFKHPWVLYKA